MDIRNTDEFKTDRSRGTLQLPGVIIGLTLAVVGILSTLYTITKLGHEPLAWLGIVVGMLCIIPAVMMWYAIKGRHLGYGWLITATLFAFPLNFYFMLLKWYDLKLSRKLIQGKFGSKIENGFIVPNA